MGVVDGQVVVLAPGLQGPRTPGERPSTAALGALLEGLELPSLTRVLRRAALVDGPPGQHLEEMFFQLVGLAPGEHGEWPLAAFSRHAAHQDATSGSWLRADPVYLRPDMSKLRVFEGAGLGLDLEEARQLAAYLNESGGDELGFVLEPDTATRWFVRLDAPPRFRSVSPAMAHGEDAAACMPDGPDAAAWHRSMNLLQMLLHSAPLNQRRESRGLEPVNSLWFWGAGALPAPRALLRDVQVWAPCSWALGAADFLGGSGHPLVPPGQVLPPGVPPSSHLLLVDAFARCRREADPVAWRDTLQDFDRHWLTPLLAAVREGRIRGLQVHVGDGVGLALGPRAPWRWWSVSGWRRPPLPRLLLERLRPVADRAADGAP